MQDDTALYGAKMMQPGMTAADSEENNLRPRTNLLLLAGKA